MVVVAASVLYHVGQKSAGDARSPYAVLAVAYAVALALTLALWMATEWPAGGGTGPWRLRWGLLIGVAIVGIEAGFALAYRVGWSLSTTALLANTSVGVLLAVTGFVVLREDPSGTRLAGMAFSLLGVVLLGKAS